MALCRSCLRRLCRPATTAGGAAVPNLTLLRSITSVGPYRGGLRWLVCQAKFQGQLTLWRELAVLLSRVWHRVPAAVEPRPVLVPVPLGPGRRRRRGFNQSLQLASELGRRVHAFVDATLLRRCRETPPQSRLDRSQRLANVNEAFAVLRPIQHRPVVLIDDVVTTGATLDACARALLEAGAARVDGLTVAAAPPEPPGGGGER